MAKTEQAPQVPVDKVWGESPPGIEFLPGERRIDELPGQNKLEKMVKEHLDEHPELLEEAKANRQDVIAVSTGHGKLFYVGWGVAASALAVAAGVIVVYRHGHKK